MYSTVRRTCTGITYLKSSRVHSSGEHLFDVLVVQVVVEFNLDVELFEEAYSLIVWVLLQRAQSTHCAGDTLVILIRTANSITLFSYTVHVVIYSLYKHTSSTVRVA